MGKTVTFEIWDGISVITLNRAERRNAFTVELISELVEQVAACEMDQRIKVVVLTGAGKCFCAGDDPEGDPLFELDNALDREKYIRMAQQIPLMLHRMPHPVIGAIRGVACGAGLDLALGCDIRIAAEDALFGSMFAHAGLMPHMGGTYFLPRVIGMCRAMDMLFSGDLIDAAEAYRIGLVNKVVPVSELMDITMEMAGRYARRSGQSYRLTKWAVYRGSEISLSAALEHECFGQNLLLGTKDGREAARAFSKGRSQKNVTSI